MKYAIPTEDIFLVLVCVRNMSKLSWMYLLSQALITRVAKSPRTTDPMQTQEGQNSLRLPWRGAGPKSRYWQALRTCCIRTRSGSWICGIERGCQRVGMPWLGSRLCTCHPTKRPKWRCSLHASVDQTPIAFVRVASPGLNPKMMACMWRANALALSYRAISTWLEL